MLPGFLAFCACYVAACGAGAAHLAALPGRNPPEIACELGRIGGDLTLLGAALLALSKGIA